MVNNKTLICLIVELAYIFHNMLRSVARTKSSFLQSDSKSSSDRSQRGLALFNIGRDRNTVTLTVLMGERKKG